MTPEEQAAQAAAEAAEQKKDETAKKDEKLLTQDEVNTIIQGKVNKLKEKFGDYDEIKTKLEAFEKSQKEKADAELTELERVQKALEEKDGNLSELQKTIEKLQKDNETKAIRSAFVEAARKANIEYIEDAIALADMSSVTIEGDQVKGIEDVVANLIEKKPFLLATKKQQKEIGGRSDQVKDQKSQRSNEELLNAAAEKARKSGRLEDKIAYVNLKRELSK